MNAKFPLALAFLATALAAFASSLSLKERSMVGAPRGRQMEMPPPQISVWPLM